MLQCLISANSLTKKTEAKNKVTVKTWKTAQPPNAKIQQLKKVEYKGVSFEYNPQIFGKVTSEEVAEFPLENEDNKPDNVAPRHIFFKLSKPNQNREIKIAIYPVEDFKKMFAVSKSETRRVENEFNNLRKVLKNEKFRVENQIPYVPFIDAEQSFQTKVKRFSIQNGKGIFFLTQYNIEPSLINNEGLTYIFQGLTDDGKKYILAEFPVSIAFLPKDFETREFEGYKLADNLENKSDLKRYKDYVRKTEKSLGKLTQNQFEPNLKYYEEIISSIKIEK
ncbi:MAG TPA: hypothetical protein VF556_11205 [Pyrinomonadaceae bacterium]|jgi:hypothetical protein